jgi:predicted PurR-regulated permease PerM
MDAFETDDGDWALWIAVGLLAGGLVAYALYQYVGVLVSAIFLYYATRPIYHRINAHLSHPNLSVTLTFLVVLLPMTIVVGYALFLIAVELDRVLAGGAFEAVRPYAQPYLRLAQEGEFQALADAISGASGGDEAAAGRAENVAGGLLSIAELALEVLAQLFLLSVLLFYLLRDGHYVREWFNDAVDHDDRIIQFLHTVDDDLESVFFNNLVLIVLTAIASALLYVFMNLVAPGGGIVGTPVLLGALIGIGTIIPVIGEKIVYLPYAAYLAVLAATADTPLWHPLVFLVVSAVLVDTIPDIFIRGYLSSRETIHMGLILLGYVLGAMAFGWYGLFLGAIVAVVFYHFSLLVFPWLAGEYLGP